MLNRLKLVLILVKVKSLFYRKLRRTFVTYDAISKTSKQLICTKSKVRLTQTAKMATDPTAFSRLSLLRPRRRGKKENSRLVELGQSQQGVQQWPIQIRRLYLVPYQRENHSRRRPNCNIQSQAPWSPLPPRDESILSSVIV